MRMLACPINPSDVMTIRGTYGRRPSLPFTPGYEGVGVVEESGGGLLGALRRSKRVVVLNSITGNWAEQAVVPAKQVIPVPASLSVEQAATCFINPVTAYVMVQRVLRVPAGGWLLQTAAGSQLGRMVIRLGRRLGFRTINIVRRDEQLDERLNTNGLFFLQCRRLRRSALFPDATCFRSPRPAAVPLAREKCASPPVAPCFPEKQAPTGGGKMHVTPCGSLFPGIFFKSRPPRAPGRGKHAQIRRAHVRTPVTPQPRIPSSA